MGIRFHKGSCVFSIVASIALTVLLNLMLRGCATGAPTW